MNTIRVILPEKYHDKWAIAGGWAACPALAEDMDVWVLGAANVDTVRAEILACLDETLVLGGGKLGGCGFFNHSYFRVEVQDETRTTPGYEISNVTIRKVAQLTRANLSIHLLVTDAPNASDLLLGFDISTHQVAILHDGTVVKGPNWTPINMPPVMLRATSTTPTRMDKIAARYGHPSGLTQSLELAQSLQENDCPF